MQNFSEIQLQYGPFESMKEFSPNSVKQELNPLKCVVSRANMRNMHKKEEKIMVNDENSEGHPKIYLKTENESPKPSNVRAPLRDITNQNIKFKQSSRVSFEKFQFETPPKVHLQKSKSTLVPVKPFSQLMNFQKPQIKHQESPNISEEIAQLTEFHYDSSFHEEKFTGKSENPLIDLDSLNREQEEKFMEGKLKKKSLSSRIKKSNNQISILKKSFQESKAWSKKKITELASLTNLKNNQVYKWYWDQKLKSKRKNEGDSNLRNSQRNNFKNTKTFVATDIFIKEAYLTEDISKFLGFHYIIYFKQISNILKINRGLKEPIYFMKNEEKE